MRVGMPGIRMPGKGANDLERRLSFRSGSDWKRNADENRANGEALALQGHRHNEGRKSP
jgi:hypothetical protein